MRKRRIITIIRRDMHMVRSMPQLKEKTLTSGSRRHL